MWGGCNTDHTKTLVLYINYISYDYYLIKLLFFTRNIIYYIFINVTSEEQQVTSKCRTNV